MDKKWCVCVVSTIYLATPFTPTCVPALLIPYFGIIWHQDNQFLQQDSQWNQHLFNFVIWRIIILIPNVVWMESLDDAQNTGCGLSALKAGSTPVGQWHDWLPTTNIHIKRNKKNTWIQIGRERDNNWHVLLDFHKICMNEIIAMMKRYVAAQQFLRHRLCSLLLLFVFCQIFIQCSLKLSLKYMVFGCGGRGARHTRHVYRGNNDGMTKDFQTHNNSVTKDSETSSNSCI